MQSNNYKIPLQKKERTVREKKKETRKGGLERFFSLQAALPRLFLGRILPKKAASYQNLTGSREPLKATQISTRTTGSVGGLDFENFLARQENFRGHASRMRRRRIQLGILRRLLRFGDTLIGNLELALWGATIYYTIARADASFAQQADREKTPTQEAREQPEG
jgi:hypothetical protein